MNAKQSNQTLASNPVAINLFSQDESNTNDKVTVSEIKPSGLANKIKISVNFDSTLKET